MVQEVWAHLLGWDPQRPVYSIHAPLEDAQKPSKLKEQRRIDPQICDIG